ncbi:hypothetical protein [Sporosalibacterium faouarense]|uniref:hypothetical protein n=1 Tax=Sporosalibacterium faouarense TaxID=516123 RepID=UPI00192B26E8|nr:hypothetical protein [Sporosalibacterium faouarense]
MNRRLLAFFILYFVVSSIVILSQYNRNNLYENIINAEVSNNLNSMIKNFQRAEKQIEATLQSKKMNMRTVQVFRDLSAEMNKVEYYMLKLENKPIENKTAEVLFNIRKDLEYIQGDKEVLILKEEEIVKIEKIYGLIQILNSTIEEYRDEIDYQINELEIINNDTWINSIQSLNDSIEENDNYLYFLNIDD